KDESIEKFSIVAKFDQGCLSGSKDESIKKFSTVAKFDLGCLPGHLLRY
ncbi:6349_t:CDS:1, partial [Gigaspora rosea]